MFHIRYLKLFSRRFFSLPPTNTLNIFSTHIVDSFWSFSISYTFKKIHTFLIFLYLHAVYRFGMFSNFPNYDWNRYTNNGSKMQKSVLYLFIYYNPRSETISNNFIDRLTSLNKYSKPSEWLENVLKPIYLLIPLKSMYKII